MHWKRFIVSLAVASFLCCVVILQLNDFGITWDEPIYMRDADRIVKWLKHPVLKNIDTYLAPTSGDIHPPFRKFVAGLTHEIFTNDLKIIDNTRGYRISSLPFVFVLSLSLAYIAIGQLGYVVGILVPLIISLLPHVLFLTPLVTLDYAVASLWFIAVVTAVRGMRTIGWLLVSAVVIGLTMLTKIHGFLLLIPISAYGAWYARGRKDKFAVFVRLAAIVAVAFAVFIAAWPWLWHGTLQHITEYIHLQTSHSTVPEYIFGKTYLYVPWWYTPVMFLTTTPAFILVFFAAGAIWAVRNGNVWDRLFLMNAIFPIAFYSMPGIQRYDWVRLFLPAFPFVALTAGRGIVITAHVFRKNLRPFVVAVIMLAWLVTVYFSVICIHPWESAYYNEFIGGISGAHTIGMESEFWGNSYLGVLPWMNSHKESMMCVPFTRSAVDYYQAMGQIQAGVVFEATGDACRYEIILMRQGYIARDSYVLSLVTRLRPVYAVSVDGVPLVGVFDRWMLKH